MAGRGRTPGLEKSPPAARGRMPASAAEKLKDALTQPPAGPRRPAAAIRAAVPPDQAPLPPPPPPTADVQPLPRAVDARQGSESSEDAEGDGNVAGNQNQDDGGSQLVEAYTSRRESLHARAHLAAAGQRKLDFDKSGVSLKMILIFYLSGILVADMVL